MTAQVKIHDIKITGTVPTESLANLLALTLSSRKIKHNLPINVNVNHDDFLKNIAPNDTRLYDEICDLWAICDSLGSIYSKVEANIKMSTRFARVEFICHK